jgi:hypothetical protein
MPKRITCSDAVAQKKGNMEFIAIDREDVHIWMKVNRGRGILKVLR